MVADLGPDRASFALVIAVGLLLFGLLQPFVDQRSGALFEAAGGDGAAFGVASALLAGASLLSATIVEGPGGVGAPRA